MSSQGYPPEASCIVTQIADNLFAMLPSMGTILGLSNEISTALGCLGTDPDPADSVLPGTNHTEQPWKLKKNAKDSRQLSKYFILWFPGDS